jgi:preprotein translocase subunit SecY
MATFREKVKLIANDTSLRKKILFVLLGLVLFRILAVIPIPGVDTVKLASFFRNNQFFGLLNVFSGSGLSTLSIVMLGVGPYITSSIIMQLLTMMSSKLKALYHEEGEAGRAKFSQYSRRLSVPLAFIQAYAFLTILIRSGAVYNLSLFQMVVNIIVVTAGSVLLMWIGELITEYGIGNGLSMIIFAGIVARIPQLAGQFNLILQTSPGQFPLFIGFAVLALIVVWVVVIVTEAERPIPVTYAKRVRGSKVYGGVSTYLPLRVNQAGVIPIIFALSILLFPQMILEFAERLSVNPIVQHSSQFLLSLLANSYFHSIAYFLLVFVFTYFYTAVTFDPKAISENLQKSGAFIPGVRPGESTSQYLAKVVTRITLVGAVFLALIAVLPFIMQTITQNNAFAIGGTALLIVVSVIIDLIKKVEGQVSMREY